MPNAHIPKQSAISNYSKPTYIILTIDNSNEKGYVSKKDTPKSNWKTIATASYQKQGQSYQQLSNLKSRFCLHMIPKYDSCKLLKFLTYFSINFYLSRDLWKGVIFGIIS